MVTTDRLRADIDAGRTGNKIPAPDPSAAPLGSDDEAAGNAPDEAAVALARRYERGTSVKSPPETSATGSTWVLAGVIALFAVVITATALAVW